MEEINDHADGIQVRTVNNNQRPPELEESRVSTGQGKYYKQTYRRAWENLPDFKGWLQGVAGKPARAFCSYCQVTLFAHRLSLLKHTCTIKHQRAAQKMWLLQTIKNSSSVPIEPPSVSQSHGNGLTVTILHDETDEQMQVHVGENISEEAGATMISDVDLDLNLKSNSTISVDIEGAAQLIDVGSSVTKPREKQTMAHSSMYPLSTHVLDTSIGQPAGGIQVSLYRLIDGRWTLVNESLTSQDGRCNQLIEKSDFVAGRYKLHFDTDRYFELQRKETLYPFIEIAFDVHAPQEHYHIPLLLTAFGYTTYRGS